MSQEHHDISNHWQLDHLLKNNRSGQHQRKHQSSVLLALYDRNAVTGCFPAQRTSNMESVSMSSCQYGNAYSTASIQGEHSWILSHNLTPIMGLNCIADQWVSARLQYLHCWCIGDTAILHWPINDVKSTAIFSSHVYGHLPFTYHMLYQSPDNVMVCVGSAATRGQGFYSFSVGSGPGLAICPMGVVVYRQSEQKKKEFYVWDVCLLSFLCHLTKLVMLLLCN